MAFWSAVSWFFPDFPHKSVAVAQLDEANDILKCVLNFKNHSHIKELLKQAATIVMTCHWLVSFFLVFVHSFVDVWEKRKEKKLP